MSEFILGRIKLWEERNSKIGKPVTHKDIWQGSYDVIYCEQDAIDAVEMPKAHMKVAEESGLIQRRVVEWRGYSMEEWSITELGEEYLRPS